MNEIDASHLPRVNLLISDFIKNCFQLRIVNQNQINNNYYLPIRLLSQTRTVVKSKRKKPKKIT